MGQWSWQSTFLRASPYLGCLERRIACWGFLGEQWSELFRWDGRGRAQVLKDWTGLVGKEPLWELKLVNLPECNDDWPFHMACFQEVSGYGRPTGSAVLPVDGKTVDLADFAGVGWFGIGAAVVAVRTGSGSEADGFVADM